MRRVYYRQCRHCGRFNSEQSPTSRTGLCPRCGVEALTENIVQMVEHRGPNFLKWRQGMARSVGAELPATLSLTP